MVNVIFSSICNIPKGSALTATRPCGCVFSQRDTQEISQRAEEQNFEEDSIGFTFLNLMWLHLEG